MIGRFGLPELLIVLALALLVFGPRKIGELGKGLGEGIRGFKSSLGGSESRGSEPDPPSDSDRDRAA